jgi:hypothetical protein
VQASAFPCEAGNFEKHYSAKIAIFPVRVTTYCLSDYLRIRFSWYISGS